jgi:hypothetical protein
MNYPNLVAILLSSMSFAQLAVAADMGMSCTQIKQAVSGQGLKRHAVKFQQPETDRLVYRIDLNGDKRPETVEAICGNGLDASCEITVNGPGVEYAASIPGQIRVLRFSDGYYAVSGVRVAHSGELIYDRLLAYRLSAGGAVETCSEGE